MVDGAFQTVHRLIREVYASLHKEASCQGITIPRHDLVGLPFVPYLVTALTLIFALGIVHRDSRTLHWLDSTTLIWPHGMRWIHCKFCNWNPKFPITLYRALQSHFTGCTIKEQRGWMTTLRKSAAQPSHWTLCVYEVYHANKQKGAGGTQSFLGGKEQKPKRF